LLLQPVNLYTGEHLAATPTLNARRVGRRRWAKKTGGREGETDGNGYNDATHVAAVQQTLSTPILPRHCRNFTRFAVSAGNPGICEAVWIPGSSPGMTHEFILISNIARHPALDAGSTHPTPRCFRHGPRIKSGVTIRSIQKERLNEPL